MLHTVKKKIKDQRGFTLIELLAVIVILGIIAAIAVPNIVGIIDKSKNDAKVAEALEIIHAAKLDHASHPEIVNWQEKAADATTGDKATPQYGGLETYLDNVQDHDYTVSLKSGKYYISGHDASAAVSNKSAGEEVSESDLLGTTK